MIEFPVALIGLLAAMGIYHRGYKDGLVGFISLSGLVLSSVIVCVGSWIGVVRYYSSPEVTMLIWSFCIFISRHFFNFLHYWWTGRGAWGTRREPPERRDGGGALT